MTSRPIRFVHRGRIIELPGERLPRTTRTVLEWLREDARCHGTKEGCAEGDCGACTVGIGTLDETGRLRIEAVNACIRFLPTLDGKALFTVEDLSSADGPLHPVQQAMVECHGSQCGFCTPGIVMSLWCMGQATAGADDARAPSRQAIADALSGNLCRCTGYRPILDAGEQALSRPQVTDHAATLAALRTLAADPPLALVAADGEHFIAPRTLAEFARARAAVPEARVLAGATDIGLWVTKQLKALPTLLSINEVAELHRIECRDGALHIGAAASLEAAWAALVERWPMLRELWLRFASPPVRHAGTMGGNLANGSPIGDSAPVLMALDATLHLQRGTQARSLPLRSFYLGYQRNALQPGEFVAGVSVPLPRAGVAVRAYKISKRFDSDISALCGAFALERDAEGRIAHARIVFGGMAAVVQHAAHAEAALQGRVWDEAALTDAQAALAHDYQPLTDLRASAPYRLQVAQNLLRRFWLETRAHGALDAQAVSVFARPAVPAPHAAGLHTNAAPGEVQP